jgi:hypothetical protein
MSEQTGKVDGGLIEIDCYYFKDWPPPEDHFCVCKFKRCRVVGCDSWTPKITPDDFKEKK